MNKWNDKEVLQWVSDEMDDKCRITAEIIRGEIVKRTPVDTGFLKGSTEVDKIKKAHYRVSNNAIYAAQREFGGVIKPYKAQALSIPISPISKGKEPADFPDLFIVKTGGNAFLARNQGKELQFLFVLKESVTQKAHPFFRPGYRAGFKKALEII